MHYLSALPVVNLFEVLVILPLLVPLSPPNLKPGNLLSRSKSPGQLSMVVAAVHCVRRRKCVQDTTSAIWHPCNTQGRREILL